MNEAKKAEGINYPRVTEIIGPYSKILYDNIDLETLAAACERGTKVHNICNAIVNNYFVPPYEEEIEPYIRSFNRWREVNSFTVKETEKRYYDHERRFSGQVDMVLEDESGELVLLDIKTSASKSKGWPIQLAAYAHLLRENGVNVKKSAILHLKKNGNKPAVYIYDDLEEYWKIFAGMLLSYNYFLRKGAA